MNAPDDIILSAEFEEAVRRPEGGDQRSKSTETTVDNVHGDSDRPTGNARARALLKLKDRGRE